MTTPPTTDDLRALVEKSGRYSVGTTFPGDDRAPYGSMVPCDSGQWLKREDVLAALTALIEQKPVAWQQLADPDVFTPSKKPCDRPERYWRPLYAAPRPAVPEGWQLVPVEPTDEMIRAGTTELLAQECTRKFSEGKIYRAMLAAAPKPEDT